MKYILKVKDKEIELNIKNYKSAKTMKLFFKDKVLTITKSPYIPKREVDRFLKENEEYIYNKYKEIEENYKEKQEIWKSGENFLYKGENYTVEVLRHKENIVKVRIEEKDKKLLVILPEQIKDEEINFYMKKALRDLFKNNTEAILIEKLPYWENITNIKCKSFEVRDAKSKYGSCAPKTKELHFSSRLIMLKDEAIDAVIVHELCHIVYPNHSRAFYDLIENYIPNYEELDKYLKDKSKDIRKF